jgi:putative endonuclease
MFYFYIMRCTDGSLYSGSTNNLENREKLHNMGRGAVYTRTHGGGKIIYSEPFPSRKEAMRREVEVKKYPKVKKEALVKVLP